LRHGVVQAVLYREYIRKAEHLHPWFKERGLAAEKCKAAVAFPALKPSPSEKELRELSVRLRSAAVRL